MNAPPANARPRPDKVLTDIADNAAGYAISSKEAYNTARLCLMDTLGCGRERSAYAR